MKLLDIELTDTEVKGLKLLLQKVLQEDMLNKLQTDLLIQKKQQEYQMRLRQDLGKFE